MIYIWVKRGGLCNQLFQLKHISRIAPNAKIITFNFLYQEFINPSINIININFKNKYVHYIFYRLYEKFFKRIFNVIDEKNESCKIVNFLDGYWQKPIEKFSDVFSVKYESKIFNGHNVVGIHVRLNDYITWAIDGVSDASLPGKYYLDAIEIMKNKLKNPFFILFSDDIVGASKLLNSIDINFIILTGGEVEDLSLLGSCSHFILSPSTFSYVGAFLELKSKSIRIAPNYWIGHKHNYWIPSDFIDSRIMYIRY